METNAIKLLEAKDIVVQFGGLKAINGVNLFVNRGEILGLIGPNGSGKTTFFNVVTGIYTVTQGDILFQGKSISGKKPQEIARLGIVRTFQNSRLWFDLSVLDNVILGMYMRPRPSSLLTLYNFKKIKEDFRKKAEEALAILSTFNEELVTNCYRRASELALVDRRRVEICRALAANPQLLLLDEPSAGMDPAETNQLMEDIKKLKQTKEDIGIIIIEHDMSVISSIAQRVVVFNFGKKIAEGNFKEIQANEEVREAYLGKG